MSSIHILQPTLLSRGDSGLLEITGTPVAFLPESPPRTRAVCTLEPESTLLVLSDGLLEIRADEKEYGDGPMQDYLKEASGFDADDLVRGLVNDAMEFGGWMPVDDDLTMMAVRRGNLSSPPGTGS